MGKMRIVIPEGYGPGSVIQVRDPETKQIHQVQIPINSNATPGMELIFEVASSNTHEQEPLPKEASSSPPHPPKQPERNAYSGPPSYDAVAKLVVIVPKNISLGSTFRVLNPVNAQVLKVQATTMPGGTMLIPINENSNEEEAVNTKAPLETKITHVNGLQVIPESGIKPGNWWYDKRSGAYGLIGGPTMGYTAANRNLGGALDPNCSNGDTGVFINGRHCHKIDIATWTRLTKRELEPGHYTLDADGQVRKATDGLSIGNFKQKIMRPQLVPSTVSSTFKLWASPSLLLPNKQHLTNTFLNSATESFTEALGQEIGAMWAEYATSSILLA